MRLFYVYSHKDEGLRDELEVALSALKRQGSIEGWHDRKISAGTDWERALEGELDAANVILLLVSADFIASDFCYGREMKRALERHEIGDARVVPVMLRECDWEHTPFAKIQALPRDAFPVTNWNNRDAAWTTVAKGIRQVIQELGVLPQRPAAPPAVAFEVARNRGPGLNLLNFQYRVTEKNNTWWRFSWMAELQNKADKSAVYNLVVDYVDEDGFVLDRDGKYECRVPPGETVVIREYNLLDIGNAKRVKVVSPSLSVTAFRRGA